jgi:hypothetical protein
MKKYHSAHIAVSDDEHCLVQLLNEKGEIEHECVVLLDELDAFVGPRLKIMSYVER